MADVTVKKNMFYGEGFNETTTGSPTLQPPDRLLNQKGADVDQCHAHIKVILRFKPK